MAGPCSTGTPSTAASTGVWPPSCGGQYVDRAIHHGASTPRAATPARKGAASPVVGTNSVNMEYDHPGPKPSYGIAGFTNDGAGVIAQQRYDLWLVPLDEPGVVVAVQRGTYMEPLMKRLLDRGLLHGDVMTVTGRTLADLAGQVTKFPQVLVNVRVRERVDLATVPEIAQAIADVEGRLHGQGRLLVRYSGTEPLLRVMLEGRDQAEITKWAHEITDLVKARLG